MKAVKLNKFRMSLEMNCVSSHAGHLTV